VLVLVLVLEKWDWASGVLEYCAKSELHPRSGLGMLQGRKRIWFRSSKGYIHSESGEAFPPPLQGRSVFADEPAVKTPG
jgi:hypothetical protein